MLGTDYLLRNAGRIASRRVDIDEAEEWASVLQIMFCPVGDETEPDLDASDVLAAAGRCGGAVGGAGGLRAAGVSQRGSGADTAADRGRRCGACPGRRRWAT
ncbi:MAG: hypothetical protein OXG52_05470 [bacterium]|nr:hypothetical protein [bacterium]